MSMKKIETELLYQNIKTKNAVEARIGAVDKIDGEITWTLLFPEFSYYRGLMPQLAAGVNEQLMFAMSGQTIMVILKGIDEENNLIVCSRKEAVEKTQNAILSQLELDEIISARVVAITYQNRRPFLHVDIGGGVLIEIPRNKAATAYCRPLKNQFKVDQNVFCKIQSIEPVTLSIRDTLPDPWKRADFRRDSIISGTVYTVKNEKVFIEPDLQPGILGLAPIPLRGEVAKGTRVRCKVRFFDPQAKKLHLYLTSLI